MSNLSERISLVRGVCDSWHLWNEPQRKHACRALFWLCDQFLEEIDKNHPEQAKNYARACILHVQDLVDAGAISGNLDVSQVLDYSNRATIHAKEDGIP